MRQKYYYLLLVPVIAFIAVVSYGYWKQQHPVQAKKQAPRTTVTGEMPYLPPDDAAANPDQVKRQNLDTAILNFRQAVTFKAKITINAANGATAGQVDYVKPLRMHAQLTLPSNQQMDMIAIGQTVYLKQDKDTWGMISDASAKIFATDFFASVLKTDSTLASFGVTRDASIQIENDLGKKCTRYATKYQSDKNLLDIDFCVNDKNQLAYIKMQTSDGDITTEYSNFNDVFIIERPMLPLLEHRLEITGTASSAR